MVHVAVIPGEQEAEAVPEVLLAPGAKLDQHQAGGRVRDADVQEAVGLSPDEGSHLLGDVDDGATASGVETKPGALHPGSLRAATGGPTERSPSRLGTSRLNPDGPAPQPSAAAKPGGGPRAPAAALGGGG